MKKKYNEILKLNVNYLPNLKSLYILWVNFYIKKVNWV